jgi:hypothetical protein
MSVDKRFLSQLQHRKDENVTLQHILSLTLGPAERSRNIHAFTMR